MQSEQLRKMAPNNPQQPAVKPLRQKVWLLTASGYPVGSEVVKTVRSHLNMILSYSQPDIRKAIANYLKSENVGICTMISVWHRAGERDFHTGRKPYVNHAFKDVMTSYGLACLASYCEGWLEAAAKAPTAKAATVADAISGCHQR